MKLLKTGVSPLFPGLLSLGAMAQKIKRIEGAHSPLKEETSIRVQFTYDNRSVGEFKTEAE